MDVLSIRCPHWHCSMQFRTERHLFQHYRTAHRHGEPFTVTSEREYYNNLRNAGGKDLVLSLIDKGV